MKRILCIMIVTILASCKADKYLDIELNKIEKVEVYKGFPGQLIEMKPEFYNNVIHDLNDSKLLGPTKYIRPFKFLIYNVDGKIDTIFTNGKIHHFKNKWFKSKENIIEKYRK